MRAQLILFETGGNQKFIFASNKLREIVGASQLLEMISTKFVREAAEPAESYEKDGCFVVQAGSGKALVLIDPDRRTASTIVNAVSTRVLAEAPGVDLVAVSSEIVDYGTKKLAGLMPGLFSQIDTVRRSRSPLTRFARLPIGAGCASTGLPAGVIQRRAEGNVVVSHVSAAKWDAAVAGFSRMAKVVFPQGGPSIDVNQIAEDFETGWLGVVHADGNGLGQVFAEFGSLYADDSEFLSEYNKFSKAIEDCTLAAFAQAIVDAPKLTVRVKGRQRQRWGVLPLVLGGDDLTAIVVGSDAIRFTCEYLKAFEIATEANEDIARVLNRAVAYSSLPKRLSASAGVSIVKAHFPFHASYQLAESLLGDSAKKVKQEITSNKEPKSSWPVSAIDFHVMFDSLHTNLHDIRNRMEIGETRLWGGPYLVTVAQQIVGADQAKSFRTADSLVGAIASISADELGNRAIGRSALHRIRADLFVSNEVVNQTMKEAMDHVEKNTSKHDAEKLRTSLGWTNGVFDGGGSTLILDAMSLESMGSKNSDGTR